MRQSRKCATSAGLSTTGRGLTIFGAGNTDLYNLLNTSAVLAVSPRFSRWQRPEQILPARFAKVGVVLSF